MRRLTTLPALVMLGWIAAAPATAAPGEEATWLHRSLAPSEPVHAAGLVPGWSFQITPYLWIAGITGETGGGNDGDLSIDADFSDIATNLQFAFMASAEVRNERWALVLDGLYLNLEADGDARGPRGNIQVSGEVVSQVSALQFAFTYRVLDLDVVKVDPYAGARVMILNADIDLDTTLGGINASLNDSATEAWTDPLVGCRVKLALTESFGLVALADIGGFSAGSRLAWQALAAVDIGFGDHFALLAGYRILSIDYENDVVFEATIQGPIIGFAFRF